MLGGASAACSEFETLLLRRALRALQFLGFRFT
jgi:hypothetical protein